MKKASSLLPLVLGMTLLGNTGYAQTPAPQTEKSQTVNASEADRLLTKLMDRNLALQDRAPLLQRLSALGQDGVPAMLQLSQSGDSSLRFAAIQWLDAMRVPGARERLEKMLQEEGPGSSQATLLALGNSGDPRSLPTLLVHLKSTSNITRQCTVYGLGRIGNPEAIPILKALAARDIDSSVRWGAKQGIKEIKQMQRKFPGRLKKYDVHPLQPREREPEQYVRTAPYPLYPPVDI